MRRRSGFTLIEMLVAIGILVILVSLTYVGFRYIGRPGQESQTRMMLGNLHGMLAEYETQRKLDLSPTELYPAGTVVAPGRVDSDGAHRYGDAVVRTQRVLSRLLAMPENRRAMERMPADQLLTVMWNSAVDYVPGDHVGYEVNGQTLYAVCVQANSNVQPFSAAGAVKTPEWDVDQRPVPLLRDAWGNPILFVPAGGLTDVRMDGMSGLLTVTSKGVVANGAPVPTGARPFFASAGPDGDFSKADDNVYSFEN